MSLNCHHFKVCINLKRYWFAVRECGSFFHIPFRFCKKKNFCLFFNFDYKFWFFIIFLCFALLYWPVGWHFIWNINTLLMIHMRCLMRVYCIHVIDMHHLKITNMDEKKCTLYLINNF